NDGINPGGSEGRGAARKLSDRTISKAGCKLDEVVSGRSANKDVFLADGRERFEGALYETGRGVIRNRNSRLDRVDVGRRWQRAWCERHTAIIEYIRGC